MADDAALLEKLGWRQGSVLPALLVDELRRDDRLPEYVGTKDSLLVISHDCDVVNPSFRTEPMVEVINVSPADPTKDAGQFTYGKNPRRLRLSLRKPTGEEHDFLVVAHQRFFVDRRLLLKSSPDSERELLDSRLLRLWLAKRYSRSAFPSEFNRRLASLTQQLRKPLGAAEDVTGIFIRLDRAEEIGESETYRVNVAFTMLDTTYQSPERREVAARILNEFEAILGSASGMDVESSILVSEAEFSLDDVRSYLRWDYDDISFRGEGDAEETIAPLP